MQEVAFQLGPEGWVRITWVVRGQRQARLGGRNRASTTSLLEGIKESPILLVNLVGREGR